MECRWIDGPRASLPVPRVSGLKKNNNKKKLSASFLRTTSRPNGRLEEKMRERRDRSRGVAGPLYGFAAGGEVTHTGAAISRAPIVSVDYCCDHRNQGPRDSRQKKKGGKKTEKANQGVDELKRSSSSPSPPPPPPPSP